MVSLSDIFFTSTCNLQKASRYHRHKIMFPVIMLIDARIVSGEKVLGHELALCYPYIHPMYILGHAVVIVAIMFNGAD